ncbi:MAG: hypothetical protein AB7P03_22070 [Kofleriaceae bacterium]
MTKRSILAAYAALLMLGGQAAAQPTQPAPGTPPAPAPPADQPSGAKVDAKSLMQSGVKLLEVKDYLGALAIFKGAYARFPSAKIMLNIGTTLNLLNRKAAAANAYQRYLELKDSDPTKKDEVQAVLAELDKSVGRIEIAVTPETAEVQVNTDDWATSPRLYRVTSGAFTVRARQAKYNPGETTGSVNAGETIKVALDLTAIPEYSSQPARFDDDELKVVVDQPRSRWGAIATAHLDLSHSGGAALVGVTADVTERFRAQAQAILHKNAGGFAGAAFAFLTGTWRPFAAAGVPIVFNDGPRVSMRGALGLELALSRKFSVLAEVGVETLLNPGDNIIRTLFVPALGATGRL